MLLQIADGIEYAQGVDIAIERTESLAEHHREIGAIGAKPLGKYGFIELRIEIQSVVLYHIAYLMLYFFLNSIRNRTAALSSGPCVQCLIFNIFRHHLALSALGMEYQDGYANT